MGVLSEPTSTLIQPWFDRQDDFLSLFPHRYDYLWAEHPAVGDRPVWRTERRHLLSDRLIRQAAYLYGVRFGAQTHYCLLDIDRYSQYHPQQDPFAIGRIVAALEPIGLVSYLACQSSYSGGIHLYLPFKQAQSSWCLAIVVATLLENAGFKLVPGHLEVFPNPKPFVPNQRPTLFNGHRLPLQAGSYLLDAEFQPVWTDESAFVAQWQFVRSRNEVERSHLRRILKQVRRQTHRVSHAADKFLNDLNAEIEVGWTGFGQTNRLLGRIAMRSYVFHHVLSGGVPLVGQALVDEIVATAQKLPGYHQWCQHHHDLEQRAIDWARCVEKSRYFHYGKVLQRSSLVLESPSPDLQVAVAGVPTWNQQQSSSARERIRSALAAMLEQGTLPPSTTARFRALVQAGIGGSTLYRHRDLWHPQAVDLVSDSSIDLTVDNSLDLDPVESLVSGYPPVPPNAFESVATSDCVTASAALTDKTLFSLLDRNSLQAGALLDPISRSPLEVGRNSTVMELPASGSRIQVNRQRDRMAQFLQSGDPILMAEALAWANQHPNQLISLDPSHSALGMPATVTTGRIPLADDSGRGGADSVDYSDLLAWIVVQIECCQWSSGDVSDRLYQLLGKRSQALLTDVELLIWADYIAGMSGVRCDFGQGDVKDGPDRPIAASCLPLWVESEYSLLDGRND